MVGDLVYELLIALAGISHVPRGLPLMDGALRISHSREIESLLKFAFVSRFIFMNPLVCCILPYHLPLYVDQALDCYHRQTYANKVLAPLDTAYMKFPIGTLRNLIIRDSPPDCIIAHWDSDDWSDPRRIESQVAFMLESGSGVVGYRDMPFYNESTKQVTLYDSRRPTGYVLGTSLMYRRDVWKSLPFPDSNDEDGAWQRQLGSAAIKSQSSLPGPMMVARIHPRNTSPKKGARYHPASPELEKQVNACIGAQIAL